MKDTIISLIGRLLGIQSEISKTNFGVAGQGAILLLFFMAHFIPIIALLAFSVALDSFAIKLMWQWFAVSLFGLPVLTFIQIGCIVMLVGLLNIKISSSKEITPVTSIEMCGNEAVKLTRYFLRSFFKSICMAAIKKTEIASIVLLTGYVVHLFI